MKRFNYLELVIFPEGQEHIPNLSQTIIMFLSFDKNLSHHSLFVQLMVYSKVLRMGIPEKWRQNIEPNIQHIQIRHLVVYIHYCIA